MKITYRNGDVYVRTNLKTWGILGVLDMYFVLGAMASLTYMYMRT